MLHILKNNKKLLTFETQKYIIIMGFKSEVKTMPEKKKMGRPTDNPKQTQFSIRFDEETLSILDRFCKKENVSRPEGVRRAVRNLEKE